LNHRFHLFISAEKDLTPTDLEFEREEWNIEKDILQIELTSLKSELEKAQEALDKAIAGAVRCNIIINAPVFFMLW